MSRDANGCRLIQVTSSGIFREGGAFGNKEAAFNQSFGTDSSEARPGSSMKDLGFFTRDNAAMTDGQVTIYERTNSTAN